MFCVRCGAQIRDGSLICDKCGATQTNAPDYEYKTVRCYPSEATEERYREFYENCGWKVTDMDRRQTFEGQSGGTKTYATQTHIKLQRDKNMPYYEEIRALSAEAESYFDTTPKKKSVLLPFACSFAFLICLITLCFSMPTNIIYIAFCIFGVPFIAPLIIGIVRISKNKKFKESYYANKKYADQAYEKCKQLVRKSRQY